MQVEIEGRYDGMYNAPQILSIDSHPRMPDIKSYQQQQGPIGADYCLVGRPLDGDGAATLSGTLPRDHLGCGHGRLRALLGTWTLVKYRGSRHDGSLSPL